MYFWFLGGLDLLHGLAEEYRVLSGPVKEWVG